MDNPIRVSLFVNVDRRKWREMQGDEPRDGVAPYLLHVVRNAADRIIELDGRIMLAGPPENEGGTSWASQRIQMLVSINTTAWLRLYGVDAAASLPHYLIGVLWQANVFTRDNGTVTLLI